MCSVPTEGQLATWAWAGEKKRLVGHEIERQIRLMPERPACTLWCNISRALKPRGEGIRWVFGDPWSMEQHQCEYDEWTTESGARSVQSRETKFKCWRGQMIKQKEVWTFGSCPLDTPSPKKGDCVRLHVWNESKAGHRCQQSMNKGRMHEQTYSVQREGGGNSAMFRTNPDGTISSACHI